MKFAKLLTLCLLLSALGSTAGYSQTSDYSTDSVCYSARENAGITRALLELRERRSADSVTAIRIGYCNAYRGRVDSLVAQYVDSRSFLGIGLRGKKRKLVKALRELP